MPEENASVKYPECEVAYNRGDNVYAILLAVEKELVPHLVNEEGMERAEAKEEFERFKAEALSDDYDFALATCERWVTAV